jgi:hypothetical protein
MSTSIVDTSITNLTPHDIVVITESLKVIFPKTDECLRCTGEPQKRIGMLESGVDVYTVPTYDSLNIPIDSSNPKYKKILVSAVIAEYLTKRNYAGQIYIPDSSPESAVRDSTGTIIGVKRLVRY